MAIRPERIRFLTLPAPEQAGSSVVVWLSRDRRVQDNWAMVYGQEQARARGVALEVVFCLVPQYLGATIRQYDFLLAGLEEMAAELATLNIGFTLLLGDPSTEVPRFVHYRRPQLLVTDFEPLRIKEQWVNAVAAEARCEVHQVDAHNVVPAWHVTTKQEFGAYTIRPKIHRLLDTFLDRFPPITRHPYEMQAPYPEHASFDVARSNLTVDASVNPVAWITPGPVAAKAALDAFVSRIHQYEFRNNPTKPGQSNLSPYLHFGQLAPQRAAITALNGVSLSNANPAVADFIEELVVRRELADNFTFRNPQYDSFDGFPAWAQQTLNEHRTDPRDFIYSVEQWESAATHDALWNAAQTEMVTTGKMHGYLRMYWAKKILEWSTSPEEAMTIAIYLNDKYELDGRDPNGYTGIAWSIGGVHDRAWFERPVFGKIRYMNANGCARKFDVKEYIRRYDNQTLF